MQSGSPTSSNCVAEEEEEEEKDDCSPAGRHRQHIHIEREKSDLPSLYQPRHPLSTKLGTMRN